MTPDVRVVRGAPDEHELAALVAGLAAGSVAAAASQPTTPERHDGATEVAERRRWRHAGSPLAAPARPGPDAWRWSLRG